ncbi:hypothetical protein TYRP_021495 [Tyrophagus putrescentiae]|nr:hypothetical protein TYRP_021495 [Tyrophagus putrescentiae]
MRSAVKTNQKSENSEENVSNFSGFLVNHKIRRGLSRRLHGTDWCLYFKCLRSPISCPLCLPVY